MIQLHRLRGERFLLNPDLIEVIESTPETVVTLVDGRKTVVSESPDEVAQRVVRFRAAILAASDALREEPERRRAELTVLTASDPASE